MHVSHCGVDPWTSGYWSPIKACDMFALAFAADEQDGATAGS